jgi:type II secretory pathway component PulC
MHPVTYKIVKIVSVLLVALAVAVLGYAILTDQPGKSSSHDPVVDSTEAATIIRPEQSVIPPENWLAIASSGGSVSASKSERFRLAGTFFLMSNENDASEDGRKKRLAIVDDLVANTQHIVSEGQSFEEHDIVRIYQDRIILRHDGVDMELSLSFKDGADAGDEATATASATNQSEEVVLETTRFGKRVGESRWVFQKQALVDYYQELLDNPERIAAIYMSMKPDYDTEGEVAGYRVEKEGESDFFDAVGLLEGDKIRKVNSMNMVSQARGEYFISEFMKDRLGAVVIDVERNGQEQKLIYLFR